jgi:phosphatidylethanolamine/phosphatidyl-N-methylethanolamine N-methyltransferase
MSGEAEGMQAGTGFPAHGGVTLEGSRRGYRAVAPVYDAVFGLLLHHGRRVGIAQLDCQPGDRILELCIGSGLSLPLYPPAAQVTGVDLSAEMLARASRRLDRMRRGAGCSLLRMNAERLAFADGSFDKAVVLFGVAGLPDPVRALQELRRVCRPGATIVLVNRFRSDAPWARALDLLLAPVYRLLRYRVDLDGTALLRQSGLEVIGSRPVNLLGYATALVCRTPDVGPTSRAGGSHRLPGFVGGALSCPPLGACPDAGAMGTSTAMNAAQADSAGPASMPS